MRNMYQLSNYRTYSSICHTQEYDAGDFWKKIMVLSLIRWASNSIMLLPEIVWLLSVVSQNKQYKNCFWLAGASFSVFVVGFLGYMTDTNCFKSFTSSAQSGRQWQNKHFEIKKCVHVRRVVCLVFPYDVIISTIHGIGMPHNWTDLPIISGIKKWHDTQYVLSLTSRHVLPRQFGPLCLPSCCNPCIRRSKYRQCNWGMKTVSYSWVYMVLITRAPINHRAWIFK